jgi:hypothetical protein
MFASEVRLYWPARRHPRPTGSDITSKKVAVLFVAAGAMQRRRRAAGSRIGTAELTRNSQTQGLT